MPTGYTAKLMESGESFEDFVMQCARAFGALVIMRDEPMNAPIPEEFKPSPYYSNSLAEHTKEWRRLASMSEKDQQSYGLDAKNKAIAMRREWLAKYQEENARIEGMRKSVVAWPPPSPDHVGLRDFMLEQLKISLHDTAYTERDLKDLINKTPARFYDEALEGEARHIKYSEEGLYKERKSNSERNLWVKQLRESLEVTVGLPTSRVERDVNEHLSNSRNLSARQSAFRSR